MQLALSNKHSNMQLLYSFPRVLQNRLFKQNCMNGLVKKDGYTEELNSTKYNKTHILISDVKTQKRSPMNQIKRYKLDL